MKPIPILVVNLKGRPENTFDKTHFVNDEWFDNPEWWHFEKNVQWHDCPLTKDGEYTAILVWQYQITHGLRKGEWEYFLEQYEHKLFNKSGAPERQIWRIVPQPQEPSDRVKKLHAMSIPMKEGDRFKKEEQTMEKLSEQDLIDQPKEQVIERQFKNNCDYGFKQRNVNSFIRMAFESGFENGMNYQKYNSDLSKPFPETIAQVEAYDKKSGDPDINFPIDEQWSHLKARMDREKEEAKTVEGKSKLEILKGAENKLDISLNNVYAAMQAYSSQQNTALIEENTRLKDAVIKISDICVKLSSENINNLPFIKDEAFKCVSIAIEALKPKQ